ncbi:histone deacetylase family protein [Methyloversatilis thermotolerans]|uniref:histone deacetylase family protein n=1 Tax=Methyloversatilis thermotolerans TaxID=1346290 RepID=UPI0003A77C1E|nr:histone deacetylase family protein [Methyloversatilis thermotolerans]
MGPHHPECPQRLAAIQDRLIASGLDAYLSHHDAPVADIDMLSRAHSPEYLRQIFDSVPGSGIVHLDPDTAMCPNSLRAALRAAGAGVHATDLVMAGAVSSAFCAVRPPGHHAEYARAMGFCFFNNVVVAARHALEKHGLERVAIIDFDVHHGNGTENIVAHDSRILMVSIFQHPFYPYSGAEPLADNLCNVPLPAGTRGEGFREVVSSRWLPRLEAFAPQMLFISAGFDAHYEDDMASLGLVEADYAWVSQELMKIAHRHAKGRVVSMLEGGYALSALGRSAVEHIRALAEL